jgi:hypothetical protein
MTTKSYAVVDGAVASEVCGLADAKAAELTKVAFQGWAREELGVPVYGTKRAMLQQVKDFYNRLAVSHHQCQF